MSAVTAARNGWTLGILSVVVLVVVLSLGHSSGELAEQAGLAAPTVAAPLDAGGAFSCALLATRQIRCWGLGSAGRLGYGNANNVGDNETPDSAGPINLGAGRSATSLAAGNGFACAVLDTAQVRCWGYALQGELGYASTSNVGDNEAPGSVGPVDLGAGRTATAITAGDGQTCAILDTGQVRCWGYGIDGQLGYGNTDNVGDNETPGSVGPVNLGADRTAVAISAGDFHTCAILDTHQVRCWGDGADGRLGYGNTNNVGDNETPDSVGPVDLGPGRTAIAISAGGAHTCVILDTGQVRCWGSGSDGQLGYGNANSIGDDETPGSVGPVDLGPGRTAVAISAGRLHTCVILDTGAVRCWGSSASGQLGYGNTNSVGDNETPGSVGPVNLGAGRTAVAIAAGGAHTCAGLDTGDVRCWGDASDGQLGYANTNDIGDNETPDSAGPVRLGGSIIGTPCMSDVCHPICPGSPGCPPVTCPGDSSCPPPTCPGDPSCKPVCLGDPSCHAVHKHAVAPFSILWISLPAPGGSGGRLYGFAKVDGEPIGSTINVRCLRECNLERSIKTTKTLRGIRLRPSIRITAKSRIRVTVSRTGKLSRYRTYRFRRAKKRLQGKRVVSGCATDVRGTRLVRCPIVRKTTKR
jgi:alpha-tubulin suppressor-like RCC1 family protein